MISDRPTNELDKILLNTSPGKINTYLRENRDYLADEKRGFYYYLKDVVEEKGIFLKDIYSFAGVSETYGSKIVKQEKHTTNRDLIIRICVAGHLSVIETNRALKLYGMSPLYAKEKRDACLLIAINNRIYDLGEIDELLEEQGFLKLSATENIII